jgi:hypothetical protein
VSSYLNLYELELQEEISEVVAAQAAEASRTSSATLLVANRQCIVGTEN